jgi:hypothetical protein
MSAGPAVRGPIERPAYAWLAVALELFTALGAIPVGLMFLADPTGASIGLTSGWIEATPFGSYTIPGLYLVAVNGIGMIVAAVLTVRPARRHDARPAGAQVHRQSPRSHHRVTADG